MRRACISNLKAVGQVYYTISLSSSGHEVSKWRVFYKFHLPNARPCLTPMHVQTRPFCQATQWVELARGLFRWVFICKFAMFSIFGLIDQRGCSDKPTPWGMRSEQNKEKMKLSFYLTNFFLAIFILFPGVDPWRRFAKQLPTPNCIYCSHSVYFSFLSYAKTGTERIWYIKVKGAIVQCSHTRGYLDCMWCLSLPWLWLRLDQGHWQPSPLVFDRLRRKEDSRIEGTPESARLN